MSSEKAIGPMRVCIALSREVNVERANFHGTDFRSPCRTIQCPPWPHGIAPPPSSIPLAPGSTRTSHRTVAVGRERDFADMLDRLGVEDRGEGNIHRYGERRYGRVLNTAKTSIDTHTDTEV